MVEGEPPLPKGLVDLLSQSSAISPAPFNHSVHDCLMPRMISMPITCLHRYLLPASWNLKRRPADASELDTEQVTNHCFLEVQYKNVDVKYPPGQAPLSDLIWPRTGKLIRNPKRPTVTKTTPQSANQVIGIYHVPYISPTPSPSNSHSRLPLTWISWTWYRPPLISRPHFRKTILESPLRYHKDLSYAWFSMTHLFSSCREPPTDLTTGGHESLSLQFAQYKSGLTTQQQASTPCVVWFLTILSPSHVREKHLHSRIILSFSYHHHSYFIISWFWGLIPVFKK